ncbi:mitochondrial import inner membrane translocase [Limtongia smithiae]|uniref:mitochondrial import inner membrane translocase n=1 Tax=Limtongia smithiae TaxID=1125753 RepID=UPI0034CD2F5E
MSDNQLASEFDSLDATSQQEIMQFINTERARMKMQNGVHMFTDLCFKKCIKNVESGGLNGSEASCIVSYFERLRYGRIFVLMDWASRTACTDILTQT